MLIKVTIIGVGNGGFAAAADLALAGHQVTMYIAPRYAHRVPELFEKKTISITGVARVGEAKLYKVTTDLAEALSDVDIILPVIPAYTQMEFADEIAPYIRRGHKIILTPGSTGGSLVIAKRLHELGKLDGVTIGEYHTLPYATRKTGPTSVKVLLKCKKLYFAAFPAKENEEMFKYAKELFDAAELKASVLETSLNNGNPISHPAPVVLNAGRIEYAKGEYYHYKEGISPSVAKVIDKMVSELHEILKRFDYGTMDAKEKLNVVGYSPERPTTYEAYRDSEVFQELKGPKDLDNRYLTEDTPHSLVALTSIGDLVNVDTPVMDSIVTLASTLKDEDYFKTGRTVKELGIESMTIEEIKEFLYEGYNMALDENIA